MAAGGRSPKLTEYPAEGHFIADDVNAAAKFWLWPLAKKRPAAPATATGVKR